MAVLCATAAIASVSWAMWDDYACTAEQEEAVASLMKIHELEAAYKKARGTYEPMAPCSFTQEGRTCVSRIGFTMIGTSHFAYRVDLQGAGYLATAVGARGRHFGSVITIDQTGTLNMGAATCGD